MKIRNFPLTMTDDFLQKAKAKAKKEGKPLYEWILDLMKKEIEK